MSGRELSLGESQDVPLGPVDESDRSTDAIEYAIEAYDGARFTALDVVDPRWFYPTSRL